MHNWFECKISYEKIGEDGIPKRVSESYLVDAMSFTEAEVRIIGEMQPFISGEFTVVDIRRARYAETFFNEKSDRFYRSKINIITLDEKSGIEKKTPVQILVQASTIHEAIAAIDKGMKGSMADYVVASVTETTLIDVFPFVVEAKTVKTHDENE